MSRLRVYLAGPISKGDLCHNINQATAVFVALAKCGFAPMCPHWSAYAKPCRREVLTDDGGEQWYAVICEATVAGNPDMRHADWLGIDLAWVARADALLRLPGESVGADMEVEEAQRLGIPVFANVADVIAWAEKG